MKIQTCSRLRLAACVLAGIALLGTAGCGNTDPFSKSSEPIQRTDFLLNTFVDIKIYDSDDTSILDDSMAICKDFESRFSRTIETSEIYKLNHRQMDEHITSITVVNAEPFLIFFIALSIQK